MVLKEFEVVFYHTAKAKYTKTVKANSKVEAFKMIDEDPFNQSEFEEEPQYIDEVSIDLEIKSIKKQK